MGYYLAVTKNIALQHDKLVFNEKMITVLDKDGDTLQSAYAISARQSIPLEEIPRHTQNAFIATEDKRFYKHNGFDYYRIGGAILRNLKAGGFREGASTISQQLIKNTHLTQEKTVKRKLQEWKLTKELEKRYSKEQILEKYLNTIYFGHNCFGISSAADFYFHKKTQDLTLAESAILAGLVKSPNRYSPFKNTELCQNRMRCVLKAMQNNGYIQESEYAQAVNTAIPTQKKDNQNKGYLHFVFDELTRIADEYRFTVGGRIEIKTFLDQNLQKEMESLAESFSESDKTFIVLENGAVGVSAYVSSVGNISRLPGSLIKPLLVYAPALEKDILSPATPILDEKINYAGYQPRNYDNCYHGYVSVRECVEKSLNIPAVKVLDSMGIEQAAAYMKKMQLAVPDEDKSLALALGGMKNGFPLSKLAAAYANFTNGGIYQPAAFISEITINGRIVYKRKDTKERIFSEETAYLMTDILKSVTQKGTAKKLRTLPFEVAAKTGTVGTENGNTDAYALSFTTKNTAAVWLGNADNRPIEQTGGGKPCELLLKINEYLYENKNQETLPKNFSMPKTVQRIALDKNIYETEHALWRADDLAPSSYTFSELFKTNKIPLNKSTSFSSPKISAPEIHYENGKTTILFKESSPEYYTYKIERKDENSCVVLYNGSFIKRYTDNTPQANKKYIYTITPFYKTNSGTPITLPAVNTKGFNESKKEEPPLSDWWLK